MLLQIIFNIFIVVGVALYFIRKNRPQKEDPRLSRGLQLLHSKIAVLEDLSDRVETQVKQLSAILEEKTKEVHQAIEEAESQIHEIERCRTKSLEVAEIFQDRIPHEEIIERQTTAKYIKAAKMAHAGKSVAEIAQELKMPKSEIEVIVSINEKEFVFGDDSLPAWADDNEKETLDESLDNSFAAEDIASPLKNFEPVRIGDTESNG